MATKTKSRAAASDSPAKNQEKNHSFEVGKSYLIRTVTLYYTGRLVAVTETDLLLEEAAWIADTGRFATCLKSGTFNEVEPFCDPVIVPRGCIVDATEWKHPLPRDQK
jgi:hypothetical protein